MGASEKHNLQQKEGVILFSGMYRRDPFYHSGGSKDILKIVSYLFDEQSADTNNIC